MPRDLKLTIRSVVHGVREKVSTWFLDAARRFPLVGNAYQRALRALSRIPTPEWLAQAGEYVGRRLRGSTDGQQVLRVVEVLENQGLTFWIAGGWGVDALIGQRTRSHEDLDLILDDFERDGPIACAELETLGYRLMRNDAAGIWMPKRSLLDDGAGHRIELLSFDRERLLSGLRASADRVEVAEMDLGALAFTTGTVNGRPVPCLSRTTQLLFHTGFERRSRDNGDVRLLKSDQ